jgi:hypothetical protein
MADKAKYVEPKTITDIKALTGYDEAVTLDLAEDAWSYGAPPPWGVYDIKWKLDKEGLKEGYKDEKDPTSKYLIVKMVGEIINSKEGEYDGIPVFSSVNTQVYRGKNISTMAGFIVKAGFGKHLEGPVTQLKQFTVLVALLKKEPVVKAELDWRGAYSFTDSAGKTQYENIWKHYTQFPVDKETKERLHVAMVARQSNHGGGEAEVRAQLQVARFFGKGDELPKIDLAAINKTGGGKPVFANAKPATEVPDLVLATPVLQKTNAVAKPPVATADETDLDLLSLE